MRQAQERLVALEDRTEEGQHGSMQDAVIRVAEAEAEARGRERVQASEESLVLVGEHGLEREALLP